MHVCMYVCACVCMCMYVCMMCAVCVCAHMCTTHPQWDGRMGRTSLELWTTRIGEEVWFVGVPQPEDQREGYR